MARVSVQMNGWPELSAALTRLEGKETKKALGDAMRTAMKELVLPAARRNLQGRPYATGRLSRALTTGGRTRRGVISRYVKTRKRAQFSPPIDPDDEWFYPFAVEYGGMRRGRAFAAHPFLRPALWNNADRVINRTASLLRQRFDKVWGRR